MTNILYLLHILNTNKLPELVEIIEAAPIDVNIALWEAEDREQVKIDGETITPIVDFTPTADENLTYKIFKVVERYNKEGHDITETRLLNYMKDPATNVGYPFHEYLMAVHYMIEKGSIEKYEIKVKKTKKVPERTFEFLTLPENLDKQFGQAAVDEWVKSYTTTK